MALYIHAHNGISGNMTVAALINLGADRDTVLSTAENAASLLTPIRTECADVRRNGVTALYINTVCEDRSFDVSDIRSAILASDLCRKDQALGILDTLIQAEQEYHKANHIHFHEIGCADLVFDIVGCIKAIELIGEERIVCSPVSVGGGTVTFSHGTLPVPAPATKEILARHNIPFRYGPIPRELTTPTGAAILANIVQEYAECAPNGPAGYGAGRPYEGIPNVLEIRKTGERAGAGRAPVETTGGNRVPEKR